MGFPNRRAFRTVAATLVIAAFAGCGTAMAADGTPLWTSPRAAQSETPASHAPSTVDSAPPAPATHGPTRPPAPGPGLPGADASGRQPPPGPLTGKMRLGGPAGSATSTGTASVALTFDDGPDPAQTPRLLDLLAKYDVKATFCLVGKNVAAHPGLVRRIAAEGHTLCNHTWRHSFTLGKQSPAAIRADLQRTNDAIRRAAPGAPIRFMRAPGGNFTPAFVSVAAELGMASIYWSADPRDWDHPAGESGAAHRARVTRAVQRHTGRGAIVLSHDYAEPDTIAVYRTLLPWLKSRFHLAAL
ncbi:peptidoglycan/xylan/chitin deacetylase (PgdA/CDA1 family) [Krasilnikovia cinnamomea]|uniref:Peptidoglycan/xylan/chitin deacetylase (PgdA/CDA1 family) n=1 Tax=Krasilnikovia cinnamomea TaxID=349313 RepID=A0A4Q7ZPD0_9ACTN|nr:polysaccharide deacetylase family protein [Krasilnikovia cinnamomea]RZU52179.1 peptidoglycan/xylan/chitin deacetylase (PgdA/CDA1 family) [Krasilnikovia cinnamomea]